MNIRAKEYQKHKVPTILTIDDWFKHRTTIIIDNEEEAHKLTEILKNNNKETRPIKSNARRYNIRIPSVNTINVSYCDKYCRDCYYDPNECNVAMKFKQIKASDILKDY